MLFLVLLNVWCSQPGFLKTAPHPTPSTRARLPAPLLPIHTSGHAGLLQPSRTGMERGLRAQVAFGKPGLTQRHGICIQLREGQLEASFSPPCEAEASRAVQPACEGTTAPAATQPAGRGAETNEGGTRRGGRAGGAGDTGWSWNCSAFLQRYYRKPDLISSAIYRSTGYNDVKSSSPCLSNSH